LFSSEKIIQSHAYVYNNVHGIYIVLINACLGIVPVRKEIIGILICTMGIVTMILDPKAERVDDEYVTETKGKLFYTVLDLSLALFGALYFMINSKNVGIIPVCTLVVVYNIISFWMNALIGKYIVDNRVEIFSRNAEFGCFGFLTKDYWFIAFVPYGLLASICGNAGYIFAMLFFSPEVVANTLLLEPFVAQILGYFYGIDYFPGMCTIIGTFIAALGIFFLQQGN